MSKCDSCQHYEYCCGVTTQLSKILNKPYPTKPTCYCNYANISWERKSSEVKKPKGTPNLYAAYLLGAEEEISRFFDVR